jgi:hypothetical protein
MTILRHVLTRITVSIALSILGSCYDVAAKKKVEKVEGGHDEPVIVENGSVNVDFNRAGSGAVVGFLSDDGSLFVRGNSPSVKWVRVWIAKEGEDFVEQKCPGGGGKCGYDGTKIMPRKVVFSMSQNKKRWMTLHWGEEDQGIFLTSPDQVFATSGKPHYIKAEKDADGKDQTLEGVHFKFDGSDVDLVREKKGRISVKVCTVLKEDDHCWKHTPK